MASLDELQQKALAARAEVIRELGLDDPEDGGAGSRLVQRLQAAKRAKRQRREDALAAAALIPDDAKRRSSRLSGKERVNLNVREYFKSGQQSRPNLVDG